MSSTDKDISVDALLVLVYTPSEEVSRQIVITLIEAKLIACGNVLPSVNSLYPWEGKIEESAEQLVILKTSSAHYKEIERVVSELHPYDTPAVLAVSVEHMEERYKKWLLKVLSASDIS